MLEFRYHVTLDLLQVGLLYLITEDQSLLASFGPRTELFSWMTENSSRDHWVLLAVQQVSQKIFKNL